MSSMILDLFTSFPNRVNLTFPSKEEFEELFAPNDLMRLDHFYDRSSPEQILFRYLYKKFNAPATAMSFDVLFVSFINTFTVNKLSETDYEIYRN